MTQFHDLSECDQNILLSLIVTASFSILAGLMILLSFVFIKKIRTYTFGLIFVMSKLCNEISWLQTLVSPPPLLVF